METHAGGRNQKSAAEADGGSDHRPARPTLLHPAAEHGRRDPEEEDRQREDPAEIGERPVTGSRVADADEVGHRQIEHAEGVYLPDTQMDAERRWRHHPPTEAGTGHRAFPVEKRERAHAASLPRGRSAQSWGKVPVAPDGPRTVH